MPTKSTRCSESHRKNTYVCPVSQHFKNGVNVIAFPFYLARDSKTADNLSEYYELFNNAVSDESKTTCAFKIKNPVNLDHDLHCEVSIIPPNTKATIQQKQPEASLINNQNKKLSNQDKKLVKNNPNPKVAMFNYNIK